MLGVRQEQFGYHRIVEECRLEGTSRDHLVCPPQNCVHLEQVVQDLDHLSLECLLRKENSSASLGPCSLCSLELAA